MCVGFIAPFLFLFDCNNGAAFLSGELHSFLGFLPGLTELVRVTGSIMLQRQNYCQNCCLLMWPIHSQLCYFVMVIIVLYLFICLLVLFTVIKLFCRYSKTCLKRNLKGLEHLSAEARFPFNQGILR
jgi:hypothetical protein